MLRVLKEHLVQLFIKTLLMEAILQQHQKILLESLDINSLVGIRIRPLIQRLQIAKHT